MSLIYFHKTCRNPNVTVFLLHNRGNILLAIYLNSCLFVLSGTGVFSLEQGQGEEDDCDDLNDLEVNGNWTPHEKALHEARLKAKAKRRLRKSSSRDSNRESLSDSVSGELSTDPHSPKGKNAVNDRKSRTGKGRGLPKKGEIVKYELFFQVPNFNSNSSYLCDMNLKIMVFIIKM